MTAPDAAWGAAWQAALAAEHQAAFGYPLLGPHLDAADRPVAGSFDLAHQALRDDTEAALRAAGATPVAPLVDYPALYPVGDASAARRLAVRLEDDCAQAWRYLYLRAAEAPTPDTRAPRLRATAQAALTASAVRATRWRSLIDARHATDPFPGA
jgi:uncharacterized protein DUF4439